MHTARHAAAATHSGSALPAKLAPTRSVAPRRPESRHRLTCARHPRRHARSLGHRLRWQGDGPVDHPPRASSSAAAPGPSLDHEREPAPTAATALEPSASAGVPPTQSPVADDPAGTWPPLSSNSINADGEPCHLGVGIAAELEAATSDAPGCAPAVSPATGEGIWFP